MHGGLRVPAGRGHVPGTGRRHVGLSGERGVFRRRVVVGRMEVVRGFRWTSSFYDWIYSTDALILPMCSVYVIVNEKLVHARNVAPFSTSFIVNKRLRWSTEHYRNQVRLVWRKPWANIPISVKSRDSIKDGSPNVPVTLWAHFSYNLLVDRR